VDSLEKGRGKAFIEWPHFPKVPKLAIQNDTYSVFFPVFVPHLGQVKQTWFSTTTSMEDLP
jgi:hypothetical protein